jgi:hypothetical protein
MLFDAKCQSCGAPIRWAKTTTGRRMPLDAQPVSNGNVVLTDGGTLAVPRNDELHSGSPRYRSHFATCPDAAKHRKAP